MRAVAVALLLALAARDCGIGYGGGFCGPFSGDGMPLEVALPAR